MNQMRQLKKSLLKMNEDIETWLIPLIASLITLGICIVIGIILK